MAKGLIGFTQIEEYLLIDVDVVKALIPGTPTFQYLIPLVEAKIAGVVSETFVIDWLAAALIIGNEGVKHILNRENWRGK